MPFVNGLLKKKGLQQTVQVLLPEVRPRNDRRDARQPEDVGFTYATRSGLSIGIDDLIIPARSRSSSTARAAR